jgi:uncharacterized repeat protein (TIGR01451 family)
MACSSVSLISRNVIHDNLNLNFKLNLRDYPMNISKVVLLLLLLFLVFVFSSGADGALNTNLMAPTSVNICDSNGFLVYINNTGTASENEILLNVTIPSGFFYDGNSLITFPGGSSNVDPDISGRYLEWNLTDIMTSETGVVINEIFPNPIGVENNNERIELYNAGPDTVNVSGWYINDSIDNKRYISSYIVSGNVNMMPGSFLVFGITGTILSNPGDTVNLFDSTGVQKDSVTYDVSVESQSWACMPDGSEIWNWRNSTLFATNGDLAAGDQIKVEFNLTTACGTPSGGRIKADVFYLGGSDSRSSASMLVKQGFLNVVKTPSVVEAGVGDVVNWTINVENTGLGPAYNVRVNDTLSSGLNFISIDSPGGGMNWSYDVIAPGEEKTVNISVNVTACQDLFNEVNASWGCDGSPCQEVYAKASVTLRVDSNTTVIKRPDEFRYRTIGESVNYTIEIDLPNATVLDLWVNDTLPVGLIYNLTSLVVKDKNGLYLFPAESVSTPNDGTTTVRINWSFGNFDNSANRDIVIELGAFVANVFANQAGTAIENNSASYSWLDNSSTVHKGSDESSYLVIEEPDLKISKSVEPFTVAKLGDEIRYTIVVNHTGSSDHDAYDLVIEDVIPTGLTYASSTSTPQANSSSYHPANRTIIWTYDELKDPGEVTLTYNATVDATPEDLTFTNSANVTWTSTEGPNPYERNGNGTGPNDYRDSTSLDIFLAEIQVNKTVSPSSGAPSTNVTFVINVTNTGGVDLDPVIVVDTLPTGLNYVSDNRSGTNDSQHVTWTLPRLNVSDSTYIELVAHINGAAFGPLENEVNVTGVPPTGTNVTDGDTEIVTAIYAAISVRKSVDIPVGEVCTNVTFTIVINNTGQAHLYSVVVTDTLPLGLDYISSDPTGDRSGNTVIWNLANMTPGEMKIVELVAHINGAAFGNLTNLVEVEGKPEHGDNVTDNDTENVTALGAEIDVEKSVDIPVGSASTRVNFTILVNNTGKVALDPVIVTDTLPYGLDDPVPSGNGSVSGNVITWNIGGLNVGDARTLWLEAHINGEFVGNLTNRVEVEGDPEFGENVTDNDSVNVTALGAKIDVEKSVDIPVGEVCTNVTFTIVINNTGNADLNPVIVTDTLPPGLDNATSSHGGTESNGVITWNLGRLNASDSVTLNLEAHINGSAFGNLTNLVEVVGKLEHGNNVTDEDSVNVTALGAKIEVEKCVDIPVAKIGTNVTFTINVTNTGNADLDPVVVTDTLPFGLVYVSSTDNGSESGGVITWNLGRMNSSDSRSIELVAQITGSTFDNMTNLVEAEGKPEHGDNVTDSDTENVKTFIASLEVNKTANVTATEPFKDVNYTIVVTNTGNIELVPVIVNDILPTGIDYVSAYPQPESVTPPAPQPGVSQVVVWNLTEGLDPGESATIFLIGFVNGNDLNTTNIVRVLGFAPDGSATNFTEDNETTDIYRLEVNKTASKTAVKRGEDVTYTISVCNTGTVPLINVVVRDVFDKAVEQVSVSYTWSGVSDLHIERISEGEWIIELLPSGACIEITLVVKVPKQEFEFDMDQGVSGEGFVNVANDYSTTLLGYLIHNNVMASTAETGDQDSETVAVLGEPGTELSTREHGSGSYESEEQVRLISENKSISMDKDVEATFGATTLGLYNNRTLNYSSRWTEEAMAKNRITGASMSESYRYITRIDRESSLDVDKNGSTMTVDSEFEGMGHIGFLKKDPSSGAGGTPTFEAREEYVGSFKVLEKVDEYGSAVSSEKAASGEGLVVVDKRVGESQRSYESGTGRYDSEELIRTHTNYIAKDISLEYAPSSLNLTGANGTEINSSMKWKEGIYSKTPGTSYIGEEYTGATELDKETIAKGLNEMDTSANFSGRARFRAVLGDEVDFDEQYEGDYSIERRVLFSGVPKYDRPHLDVVKNGSIREETIFDAKEETLAGESRDRVIKVATYTITLKNDGNKALGPIYVRDLFPPGALYISSSVRPSELTDTYANWTLTHLAIGDVSTIILNLDVTEHHPDELVNRVFVTAGYDGDKQITASNFSALEMEWLTCCPNETVVVKKTAEIDETNSSVVWYRIEISNMDDVTRAATVSDSLPGDMVLLDSTVPFASYEMNTVVWNLVEIGPFETATIVYRVEAQHAGRFVNTVMVDARSVDGPVVQPVTATSVIDVGEVEEQVEECGETSCSSWSPPAWEFDNVGSCGEPSCEELGV